MSAAVIMQLVSLGISIAVRAPQYIAEYEELMRQAETMGDEIINSPFYLNLKHEVAKLNAEIQSAKQEGEL